MFNDNYELQYFDGNDWYTTSNIFGGSQMTAGYLRLEMQQLQQSHPGRPIRIVDGSGRIVDML